MSIWSHVFDNEFRQRADIDALKQKNAGSLNSARRAARKSKALEGRVEELEGELGELTLLCRALLTLLRQEGVIDPAALEAVMTGIDAEDGVLDGKVTPERERPQAPKARKAPKAPRRRPRR